MYEKYNVIAAKNYDLLKSLDPKLNYMVRFYRHKTEQEINICPYPHTIEDLQPLGVFNDWLFNITINDFGHEVGINLCNLIEVFPQTGSQLSLF